MSAKFTRRVLIPAAGFGKRAGGVPAKELILDPVSKAPLIDLALAIAAELGVEPVVITRHDKAELISYLEGRGIRLHLTGPTREWPETVLRAKSEWRDANLVLLPDAVFSPRTAAGEIFEILESGARSSFAMFSVDDLSSWGAVKQSSSGWLVAEKPKEAGEGRQAWGLFGFRHDAGDALLGAMLRSSASGCWQKFDERDAAIGLVHLEEFFDRTR